MADIPETLGDPSPLDDYRHSDSVFERLSDEEGTQKVEQDGADHTAHMDDTKPLPSRKDWLPSKGLVLKGTYASYVLDRALASGGMGMVWLANRVDGSGDLGREGTTLPQQVALKVTKTSIRIDPVVMIRKELGPLLAIGDKRVVRLVDWTLEGTAPFLAFEYMAHGSLQDEIANRREFLPEDSLLRLAKDILVAVAAAHRACLLHLDIKPSNLLCDGAGGYLLADFGVAQGMREGALQKIPGCGTLAYHAPEQYQRDFLNFDARTDLFGIGMTLYASAVRNEYEVILGMREDYRDRTFAMPSLQDLRPELRPDLCELIMELIRNDRMQRPGSASEVLAGIDRMINGDLPSVHASETLKRRRVNEQEAAGVVQGLVDDVWKELLTSRRHWGMLVKFQSGEVVAEQGEKSFSGFVLLRGNLAIEINGAVEASENREGEMFGEIAAFAGSPRSATVRALSDSYLLAFNPSDFEGFVANHPMVAIRLIRSLCKRYLKARGLPES